MDINELRKEIDKTNSDMLNLFIKRMELSQKIAEYKRENSLPVTDKKREREILSNVTENAGEYAHEKASEMTLEYAVSSISVPFHPGAERYFKEVGAIAE